MKKNLTRKDFLVNMSKAAVGVTAVASVSSLVTTATAKAETKVTPWPWPYTTLSEDNVRIRAHDLYWNDKDCCAGVFGAIVQELAVVMGDPWTGIPIEVMLFGRGGGNSWGIMCGAINGGAAAISLVVDKATSGNLLNELFGWYTQENFPTTTANQFAKDGKYTVHKYDNDLPQSVSGSPLCHASVTEWCNVANVKVGDTMRKERCGRLAGDVAAKTVEILNASLAKTFTPTYVDPSDVTSCLGCHGSNLLFNVSTRMDCKQCHPNAHTQTKVEAVSGSVSQYQLSQNYPNPFNPSTKLNFSIPQAERVNVSVYDITGNLVRTLVDHEYYQAGNYQVEWNGRNNEGAAVPSGIYFARLQSGKFTQTRKMVLVK
jgi:hypothetical protein